MSIHIPGHAEVHVIIMQNRNQEKKAREQARVRFILYCTVVQYIKKYAMRQFIRN
jgi:hypothetical protein